MDNQIEGKLIPYNNKEDLRARVSSLFDWDIIGDPSPKMYSPNSGLPLGVLLSYPRDSWCFSYFPGNEFVDLMKYLPKDHEIVGEIIHQAKANLEEITQKSREELQLRTPRYLNSFGVGNYSRCAALFPTILAAAYHVADLRVTNDWCFPNQDFPTEARILWSAAEGVQRYIKSHPQEAERFFDHLYDHTLLFPSVIGGYRRLGNEKAITVYFELFNLTQGEENFVLDNLHRVIKFDYFGKLLQKSFPDYNFAKYIEANIKPELRSKLKLFL